MMVAQHARGRQRLAVTQAGGCLLQEGEDDRLRVGRGASTAVPPLTTFTGEILANVSANVSCDDNKENSTRHTDGGRAGA